MATEENLCRKIRNYFREYCTCTSIHGFRYFGEKRTIFERVWWFFVFVVCLAACVLSIFAVYKKWESSPVIVSFATRGTPIYQIPFPAVTVCPESKAMQNRFNFTNIMHKKEDRESLTETESINFEYMSMICKYYPHLNYTNNETFADDFFAIIDELKPKFLAFNCQYMGLDLPCDHLFTPLITDEGICYTFNMLNRSEMFRENVIHYKNFHMSPKPSSNWSIEHGYTEDAGVYSYPWRAFLAGVRNAFSFKILTPKAHNDYACKDSLQGYRILLHAPMRLPRPSQNFFRLPLNQDILGAVQPVMITTSESVKLYNPKRRECYFVSERYLKYFKIYSQLNCMMECLANYTHHMCGCVNFYMPRENGTEICGSASVDCMNEAESDLQMRDLIQKINEAPPEKAKKQKKRARMDCDCLPICADLTYDVETSQSDWKWDEQRRAHRLNDLNASEYHMSSLTIFFKSGYFITSQRNQLYGPTEFLANFGGLLGLFTGFSVLSLMEIIYFLSVRLCCNVRLYGYWSGPQSET